MARSSVVGGIAALVLVVAVAGLRIYSLFGMADPGAPCGSRFGCKSYLCAAHELRGGALVASEGYCTVKCKSDGDCGAPGLRCELTPAEVRKDVRGLGIPDHLCIRRR